MSIEGVPTGVGAPLRRREDQRLLRGRGEYSDDKNLPGQAHAAMVRSPPSGLFFVGTSCRPALK
jgi:carbon-monoxide dehydrogenase large subunit